MNTKISFIKGKLPLGTFGISMLLHIAVFFSVSSWVLIQAVAPKITPSAAADSSVSETTDAPPELPEDETPELPSNDPQDITDTTVQQTGMPTDVITAAGPSNFTLPASVGIYVPGAAVNSSGAPSQTKDPTALTKKITVGNIFNTHVEAGKLGVIVDISGSAHSYLPKALEDVQRNFADAVIVFAFGCGMSPDKKWLDQAKFLPFKNAKFPAKAMERTTLSQIKGAMNNPQNDKVFKRLKNHDTVFYVEGGDFNVTQVAFAEIVKQGVDTIFWFADFEDGISDIPSKKVLDDIKSRGIKVYVNNFSGNEKTAGMKFATTLAKETGGTVTCKKK